MLNARLIKKLTCNRQFFINTIDHVFYVCLFACVFDFLHLYILQLFFIYSIIFQHLRTFTIVD